MGISRLRGLGQSRSSAPRPPRKQYESWLVKAQHKYGVDASVVIGIWGLETDFGAFAGSDYVIRALASLAYAHYQRRLFQG